MPNVFAAYYYARMFLGQMEKPDVDDIQGLSPAISIDQKTTSKNPRSTVGTVTEIHDYLRLLYARAGVPHCPVCGKEIRQQTVDQIVDQVLMLPERTRIQVMAPVVRSRKGEYAKLFEDMGKQGFVRMRVDGEIYEISDPPKLAKTKKHTLEVVVDRLTVRPDIQQRLTDSLETAMKLAGGLVTVNVVGGEDMLFSQNYACPDCNISIEEPVSYTHLDVYKRQEQRRAVESEAPALAVVAGPGTGKTFTLVELSLIHI